MRLFSLFVLTFLALNLQAFQSKSAVPAWVEKVNFDVKNDLNKEGNHFYRLIDYQENIPLETKYVHYAISLHNSEGLQNFSDINVDYDPIFERLYFHHLRIIRNGQIIDKLPTAKIKTIQRESNMEIALYDGSKTAIIHLDDVQVDDIIEYAYSISGYNPIYDNHVSFIFYQNYNEPIGKIFTKLISEKDRKLHFNYLYDATEPEVEELNGKVAYTWITTDTDAISYDVNTPAWFDIQKRVEVSDYESWKEFSEWVAPLFQYNPSEIENIDLELPDGLSKREIAVYLIRKVQDDLRYLGFEGGINGYKPHNPLKVFRQKYGDCKDKSLLLSALLKRFDIESQPVLVNSTYGPNLNSSIPSYLSFNHCIVRLEVDGEEYFIDPTISQQGGSLKEYYIPNYHLGLIVDKNQQELVSIPTSSEGATEIWEIIRCEEIGGSASYEVRTKYVGNQADLTRSYFENSTSGEISKNYLNYYSNIYPSIKQTAEIEYIDDLRDDRNEITVIERYNVEDIWQSDQNSEVLKLELYPMVLASRLDFPASPQRNMPYYVGDQSIFKQKTTLHLPEDWAIKPEEYTLKENHLYYNNSITNLDNIVHVSHHFRPTKSFLDAEDTPAFLRSVKDIEDQLTYQVTYNTAFAKFRLSYFSVFLLLLTIVLSLVAFWFVHKNFNPKPKAPESGIEIGGWMILPLIGLIISPFIFIYGLSEPAFFNRATWSSFSTFGGLKSVLMNVLFISEIIYNTFCVLFSIYLIFLFFTKRTSLPYLMVAFYGLVFLFPLIDGMMVELLIPETLSAAERMETYTTAAKSFISGSIWSSYFLISERVKETFVRTNDQKNNSLVQQHDNEEE